jgi:hypothetical protein
MKQILYETPAGDFIALHHVVIFNIEATGSEEQERHEIYATTVDGKRHLLASARGTDSQAGAENWLGELFSDAGIERSATKPLT